MSRYRTYVERLFNILRWPSDISAITAFVLAFFFFAASFTSTATAAAVLDIKPMTWNIIGLDSNNPATGPFRFPVGARVCNSGDTDASNVTAAFLWDDGQGVFVGDVNADDYINLRAGSLSLITIGSLPAGSCSDAYFEVEVTKDAAAFDKTRRYHISATDSVVTGVSPQPRELYVEHLISQNRNSVTDIELNGTSIPAGGTMNLLVGNTYEIKLYGGTATQGYEQFEAFINFPNTIFQILSVNTTYSANTSIYVSSPNDKLYADACLWENDPNSPNYRSCVGVDGKTGGSNVVTTYTVKILSGAATSQTLNSLLYDFSGSSFHYNADYGVGARIVNIVGPSSVTISKSFTPKAISPGGTSTMTFKINNPTTETITGVNFTDAFPAGLAVYSTPGVSYIGCGAGAFSPAPTGSETSVAFSNGTLAPNSICTITLTVTAPAGTYPNNTGHLFINTSVDTGNTGSDTLTASSAPSCTPGQTLATWTVPSGATAPPDTGTANPSINNTGFTATSYHFPLAKQSIVTGAQSPNQSPIGDDTSWSTWGYNTDGGYMEFVVDTRNYSAISMTFHFYPDGNGPSTLAVTYVGNGSGTAATYSESGGSLTPDSWNTKTIDLSTFASTTGTTTIRITGTGANNDNSGSNLFLDDISFTGCAIPAPPPTITKSFSPDPIVKGANSTLSFTINNTQPGNKNLTGIAFTDVLPTGLSISDSTVSPVCGGTLTTTAATRTISLAGGSLNAGASCYIDVTVTGTIEGQFENVSGFISSNESGENKSANGYATDTLTVISPPDLEKSFSPASLLVGQTSTLTFSIENLNVFSSLSGISFSDVLPAGLTVANSGPTATCSGLLTTTAPSTISFSGGSLAANTSCTFNVTVTGTTIGSKNNTTSAVSSLEGGDGDAATATLNVSNPQPLLGLNKQISTDGANWFKFVGVPLPGDVYYRFTVSNDGETVLSTVSVTDPDVTPCALPASLAIGASDSCVVGPVSVTSVPTPNPFINTATADSASTNPVTSSARYGTKSLTIAKSADKSSFAAIGELLTYSYLVANNGGYPLFAPVTVQDDQSTDEDCPSVSTIGDLDNYLDPGENITCTATYTVSAGDMLAGFVTNLASASAEGVTSNTDSETVNSPGADLSITKTDNPDPVVAGQNLTYTITVNNAGPSNATNVVVTDTLPAGVTFVSTSGCAGDPNGVPTCNLGTINAGGNKQYTVTVTVNAGTTGTLTNNVSVTSNTADPNAANNSASATTTVNASADLSITKTDSPDPVIAGQNIAYTITVNNAGPSDAVNVVVTDTLPAGVTFVSTTGCAGDPNGVPTCNLGTINAGGNKQYTVTVTVNAGTTGTITNNVSVTSNTADPNNTNNSASQNTTVNTISADLSITKSDNPDPVVAGQNLTYTITVNNAGPSNATNVVATDTLPAGVTFVSTTGCTGDPNGVPTCNLGTINAGGNKQYTVTVTVNVGTTGTLTNNVSVISDIADPNAANNTASATTTVNEPSIFDPPSGFKTVNSAGYPELVWRMVWINNGNADAVTAVITDSIPANTTYVGGSLICTPQGGSQSDQCSYDSGNNRIVWQGTIAADPGALNETQAQNEVRITFRTTMNTSVTRVENQGCAQIPGGATECSDNPSTPASGDPTVWTKSTTPVAVPTMTEWGMIILLVFQGLMALYYLRRRVRI